MIRASIYRSDDAITSFQVTGHADAGPYGQDIVCAAVSVLTIAMVNGLQQVVHNDVVVNQDAENGGLMEIDHISTAREAQVLMQTLQNGLLDIQDSYPDNIEVKIFDK